MPSQIYVCRNKQLLIDQRPPLCAANCSVGGCGTKDGGGVGGPCIGGKLFGGPCLPGKLFGGPKKSDDSGSKLNGFTIKPSLFMLFLYGMSFITFVNGHVCTLNEKEYFETVNDVLTVSFIIF
ncbi:MAG: hypothetical protein ABS951_10065 [Solibacillus sp.]